jgi:UDP-N-acetylglucosamine 2-epimerase (non-hydrolysing)/GDP/UDP-N,N'-diacetylbacillosamine 2-epimerase (hydrolysing)
MPKLKVCVVTGSRAEYGLLYCLMKEIQDDPAFVLQVVATGMHLSPEFGLTYKTIEEDGFAIDAKVEMLLSSDTPVGIAKSMGLGLIGFADTLDILKPDILLLLGDRFEVFAAAEAALLARIPIAHLCGGDTTAGAFDEAIRHSITKMAHFHFVSHADAERRVKQLGENPENVFLVGSTGIDQIMQLQLRNRDELEKELAFHFRNRNLLVTFHPATLDADVPSVQFQELLLALDRLDPEIGMLFTKPNADTAGRKLIKMIDDFCQSRPHAKAYTSLGQVNYLSLMAQVDAVIGNSSSGLYEAPSLKVPTVNIGDRQKGRLQAASVIDCAVDARKIESSIFKAFNLDCADVINPYGDGHSSKKIVEVLKNIDLNSSILKKEFFNFG